MILISFRDPNQRGRLCGHLLRRRPTGSVLHTLSRKLDMHVNMQYTRQYLLTSHTGWTSPPLRRPCWRLSDCKVNRPLQGWQTCGTPAHQEMLRSTGLMEIYGREPGIGSCDVDHHSFRTCHPSLIFQRFDAFVLCCSVGALIMKILFELKDMAGRCKAR